MSDNDLLLKKVESAAIVLETYGFAYWANRLRSIAGGSEGKERIEIVRELSALYGGFGSLMDLAVDPSRLTAGKTEAEANKELFRALNELCEQLERA